MSGRLVLWHGGAPGLKPGDFILPAIERQQLGRFDFISDTLDRLGQRVARRDRVYVTPSLRFAMRWAMLRTGEVGHAYEVEPIGALEIDPDYIALPGFSYQCERARVLAVVVPSRRQQQQGRKDNEHWRRLYAEKRDIEGVNAAIAQAVMRGEFHDRLAFKVRGGKR
jgi:hypothetical protein